jgi:hypothetical protein
MSGMFYETRSFNSPLTWNGGPWNVSNVIDMSHMFMDATIFDQPLDWDVSNVRTMLSMFKGATSFNQPLNWNVSNVTHMSHMFENAISFDSPLTWNGGPWNISRIRDMSSMFDGATEFNQDLTWNIPPGTITYNMYRNTRIRAQLEKLSTKKQAYAWIDALQHLGVHHNLDFQTTKDILQYNGDPDVEKDYTDDNGNTYYMPRGGRRRRRTKRRKSAKRRKSRSHRK